jgi:hypothetical protein
MSRVLPLFLVLAASAFAQSDPSPIGEVFASDAAVKGSVLVSGGGMSVLPGASVDAGASPAVVKLRRGGTLRICPRSDVSLNVAPRSAMAQSADSKSATSVQQPPALMISMGTGALEAEYQLGLEADNIITPDFRIQLAGPAAFHVGISVNGRGDTCVRGLAGNSGAIGVSELLGAGTYQVKPNEAVLFASGAIAGARPAVEACGCPEAEPARTLQMAQAQAPEPAAPPAVAASPSVENSAAVHGEPQIEVAAPFVFQAAAPGPEVAQIEQLAWRPRVELSSALTEPQVLPPTRQPRSADQLQASSAPELKAAKPRRGFFARIGGFFAGLFGRKQKPAAAAS